MQVDYDPAKISYRELLDLFWEGHDPAYRSWSRQYAAIIFYHTEEQRRLAEASKTQVASQTHKTILTEIVPFRNFTRAENYHQKHTLQLFPEYREELQKAYLSFHEFVDSTAAARVNGYLAGNGLCEDLNRDLAGLGLSTARQEALRDLVCRRRRPLSCPAPR